MSAPENISRKDSATLDARAIIAASDGKRGAQDEPQRALWLAALHSLTLFMVALRKYLKVERCERCGR